MKAKFGTWYFLIIVSLCFGETFSKLLNPSSKNINSSSLDLTKVKSGVISESDYISAKDIISNEITSVPKYLSSFTFDRVLDHKESWSIKKVKRDKGLTANVTSDKNIEKFQSKLSPIGDYIFGSLLLVSCLFALLGNGCALAIFRFRQQRLIPMEVFFINLAAVDILLSVASYPLTIISSFMHEWNFGELGCTIYAFCCYFMGLSSIYTITAMALTRYLITCKPTQGNQITCRICCKMVAIGYLLAFCWAILPIFGFGNYQVEPFGLSCTLDWIAKDRASRVYISLVAIFCFVLPLITLIFCYLKITILVKQSNALMENKGVNKRNTKGSDTQLTLISGLISTGFIIAWFPYTIVCLWASFEGQVVLPIWLSPGPALFAKSSIVYNPFIYVLMTKRYQKDFCELVRYISCKSFGRQRKRDNTTNTYDDTATDGNESTVNPTQAYEMEGDIEGNFGRHVKPTMKHTYV